MLVSFSAWITQGTGKCELRSFPVLLAQLLSPAAYSFPGSPMHKRKAGLGPVNETKHEMCGGKIRSVGIA